MVRFLLILLTVATLSPKHPLDVDAYPRVSHAPAWVEIRIGVYPDEANRSLSVGVESADFYSSSGKDLDGKDAPIRFKFIFKDLPPGDYDARVELGRAFPLEPIRAVVPFHVE